VPTHGELAVRAADLVAARAPAHPEKGVQVLLHPDVSHTAVFLSARLGQILRRVSKVFDGAGLDDAGDPRCLRPECDVEMRPRVRDSPREPTLDLGTT
jgi:hypothetical protein